MASSFFISATGGSMKKYLKHQCSPIHGKGLFTTVPIAEGTVIGYCKVKPTESPNAYTLSCPDGDVDVTCKLKYINHSSTPNVAYYGCDLSVVALEDIPAGAELTHHYGDEWD
ncbi:MAG: SET domain-containing protein [Halieaceae bacterium]|nr:SET domain-containing protein [Halieaceae bacterium]